MTLELESGINDPVAVILTTTLTYNLLDPGHLQGWQVAVDMVVQLAVGAALGAAVAYGGRFILGRLRLATGGLYPALTLALALLAYGVPTLLHGSGFLAVYLAGLILGNGPLPYRAGLLRVHDALAWLAQIGMFLVLGLLVFPSQLLDVAALGLGLALLLALVIRPLVVALCLAAVRLPPGRDALHRLGRTPRGGADRAGDLPGAGGRAGRGADLPPGLLHRGGERGGAGRHGARGRPSGWAWERWSRRRPRRCWPSSPGCRSRASSFPFI